MPRITKHLTIPSADTRALAPPDRSVHAKESGACYDDGVFPLRQVVQLKFWEKPMTPSLIIRVAAPVSLALLSACANINTIDRTTYLEDKTAKAIHLDVQQRLLIVNNLGKYCAEPSPDALAAYAAALGVSASAPTSGSVSVAGGGQSTAASIGLRTQSITLMRDALYRMCEAYANGAIGEAQVVTLLNRSQDLTAVILAVEQLTGAVAANQAALTSSSGASGFATALNNSKLFAEASVHEARALKRLEESKTEQTAASDKHTQAEAAVVRAEAALSTLEGAAQRDEEKILAAKSDLTFRRNLRDSTTANLKNADARVELYQRVYDNAQSVAAEIAKTPDSSSASSTANTTGASELSTPIPTVALSKEATVAVSGAVRDIVMRVLEKDYVLDSCMSVITSNRLSEDPNIREQELETRGYCQRLVNALIQEKAILTETRVKEAKNIMIKTVTDDADRIIGCIAPKGTLVPAKRDQLFADANANGALSLYQFHMTGNPDVSGFRTMLGLNPHIRMAMAAAVDSSMACK